jgi:hypothetical protein
MGLHPDVQREKDAAFVWWRKAGTGMKIQNSIAGKIRENPDFGVAVGAIIYSAGKHEIDFNVTRNIDAYCYVGFAVQDIDLDKSRPAFAHSFPIPSHDSLQTKTYTVVVRSMVPPRRQGPVLVLFWMRVNERAA